MTARKWNYLMKTLVVVLLVAVIGFTFVACGKNNSTPVSGVYYYEAEGEAYQITLSEDYGFVLDANGKIRSGEYFGNGIDLRLVFGKDDETTAKLENGVLKLTYNGATLTMLQRVNYTVSFNTNGGNAVAAQTVLNGKTATQPADPTRANDRFLGWYVDSAFSAPFNFDTTIITQDTTVYANWEAKNPNQPEYVISFDANYQGAAAVEAQNTYNGKLTSLPTVSREGYTFAGWWVSSLNDGSKLSYQCGTEYVFSGNTTLYALWLQQGSVAQPVVTVTGTSISWTTTANAEYVLSVTGPEGFTAINKTTQASSEAINFANAPAGVYEVSVVAKVGQNQSAASVVYYVNNGLAAPEVWVSGSATLVYSQVPNAEKYIVTIDCGNHAPTTVDNGKNTTLPFDNCEMKEGGIVFTVTAMAEGYAPATTTFVYDRLLAQVSGVSFDSASETLSWAQVVGATNYVVAVTVGGQTYTYNNGTSNSFSLKTFAQGEISVAIVPQSYGYNSPEATVYNYTKTTLSAPANVAVDGNNVTWTAVEGATKYLVSLNGIVYEATSTSFDITTVAGLQAGSKYQLSVTAVKDGAQSLASTVTVAYQVLSNVNYYANVASWDAVAGATKYKVKVGNAEAFEVVGATSTPVSFTQAGATTIAVAFYNGSKWSNWVETTVQVYSIEFDVRLGEEAVEAVYVATGDVVTLKETTRPGYDFAGWYNAPGGAAAGAYQYKNGFVYDKTTSTVVFASWTAIKVTVSYNFKGVGEVADFGTTTVTFGEDYTLKVPTAPSTAYVFAGWYEDIQCTTPLTDLSGSSIDAWGFYQKERTVYAKWYQLLTYTKLEDGTYRIKKGPDIHKVTEVTVPAEIDGVKVSQVAGFAFDKCYDLQVINIPDTIKYIDLLGKAFNQCTRLQAVNIYHVEGNNEIYYKSENGILMVYDKNSDNRLELGFVPMTTDGKFEIPNGVEVIPEKMFAKSTVTEIVIPASVTTIEANAFQNCAQLQKVTFLAPEAGATVVPLSIGDKAFTGCKNLTEITIPARFVSFDVTDAGEITSFNGCTSLENVFVEAGNAYFTNPTDKTGVLLDTQGKLVYVPNATEGAYTIPAGVYTVGAYAFAQAKGVSEVTIPAWVTAVDGYAFYKVTALTKVTFAATQGFDNAVTIGQHAFDGCALLNSVVYQPGSKVTEFGAYAFANCTSLPTLTIPATVTTVGNNVFDGCAGANNAVIEDADNTLTFGTSVFANCSNLRDVTIPARVTALPEGAFAGCSSLRNVFVNQDNEVLKDIDGVLFTKDGKKLLFFSPVRGGEYAVPAGVEEIGAKVFEGNTALSGITFGADVKVIGDRAFYGCTGLSGSTINIGANVIYVGEYAFYNTGISKLFFDQTGTEELVIGKGAFRKAINNTYTSTTSSYYFDLQIPARLKSISEEAFYESKFAKMTLAEGVKSIGAYAFASNSTLVGTTWDGKNGSLEFPTSLTSVGAYAFYKSTGSYFKVIDLDCNVTSWGAYAFAECSKLTTITFPTNWEIIPEAFFYNSGKNVKHAITIAKTVKQIESKAFYGFVYATDLIFEEGGTEDLVLGTKGYYNSVSKSWEDRGYYSSDVFYNFAQSYSTLKQITLPDRLTIIGNNTFYGAKNIQKFNISENSRLANIGDQAFYSCSSLTEIFIPDTVTNLPQVGGYAQQPSIGVKAFYSSKLTKVTFEKGGTLPLTLAANAFYNCSSTSFNNLELPNRMGISYAKDGVTPAIIGMTATSFAKNNFKTITVDEGNTNCVLVAKDNIVYYAGYTDIVYAAAKSTLTEITLPKQLTSIPKAAFKSNTTLTKVIFEEGGTAPLTIGEEAFSGCSKITEAKLPERVTTIGVKAFYNCKLMTSVHIPKSVTEIGSNAFYGCAAASLPTFGTNDDGTVNFKKIATGTFAIPAGTTEWTVPNGVETLSYNFLTGTVTGITKLIFPDSVHTVNADDQSGQTLGAMMALTEIALSPTNTNFKFVNGGLYTADGATLVMVVKGVKGNDVVYSIEEGTDTIGKYALASMTFKKVIVPNTVTKINEYAFWMTTVPEFELVDGQIPLVLGSSLFGMNRQVTSITIPARTISINGSLQDASMLTTINFAPNSNLQTVENFFMFNYITEVTFPKSVVSVVQTVNEFAECNNLRKVAFEEGSQLQEWNVVGGFMSGKSEGEPVPVNVVNFPFETVMVYGEGSLRNSNITKVNFAEGITTIPANLFGDVPNFVTEVTLPSTALVISEGAFANMQITEIALPEGLQEIGDRAFENCTLLTTINWPNSLQRIGEKAFYNCQGLTSVTIGENIQNLGLTTSGLRNERLGIDASAFENCINLETVTVAEGGTAELSIGKFAFKNTPKLTSFYFPERLVDGQNISYAGNIDDFGFIREGAFDGSGLTEVVLPYSLNCTYIGKNAFANCNSLVNVTLGFGVQTISEHAFANCEKLEYVHIPASVVTFNNAFFNSNKVALDIAPDILDYTYIDGVWYNVAETEVIYVTKDVAGVVSIPDTVKAVAPGAFKGITAITGVKFSKAMTEIAESVFEGTGITSVVIPANIKTIGTSAFKNCASLQSVTFEAGVATYVTIGASAFEGTNLGSVEIPVGVTAIGDKAFYNAGITALTFTEVGYNEDFPLKGLSIGSYAFANNTALQAVTFPQRLADADTSKKQFAVGEYAFDGCTALASVNFWTNELGMPAKFVGENLTLAKGAFTNTALTQIIVPSEVQFYSPAQNSCYGIKYFNGDFSTYELDNPVSEGVAIVMFAGPNSTTINADTAKESINLYGCAIYYWVPGNAEASSTISITADMLGDIDTTNNTAENKTVVVTGSYQGYNYAFKLTVMPHACASKCETCQGCLDAECTAVNCATKCPGHEVVETPEA